MIATDSAFTVIAENLRRRYVRLIVGLFQSCLLSVLLQAFIMILAGDGQDVAADRKQTTPNTVLQYPSEQHCLPPNNVLTFDI